MRSYVAGVALLFAVVWCFHVGQQRAEELAGYDDNIVTIDQPLSKALYDSAYQGDWQTFSCLLDQFKGPYNKATTKFIKDLYFMLSYNLDVTQCDNQGATALHDFCVTGNLEFIDILLRDKKTKVNARDNEGCTPLHYAMQGGNEQAIVRLIERGADWSVADKEGHTPVHYAVWFATPHAIEVLVKKCDINKNIKNPKLGYTPLHMAVLCDRFDMATVLVELGADTSLLDKQGMTALQLAQKEGKIEFVQLLAGEVVEQACCAH